MDEGEKADVRGLRGEEECLGATVVEGAGSTLVTLLPSISRSQTATRDGEEAARSSPDDKSSRIGGEEMRELVDSERAAQ
jgi:hypothetical protein